MDGGVSSTTSPRSPPAARVRLEDTSSEEEKRSQVVRDGTDPSLETFGEVERFERLEESNDSDL